MRLAINGNVIEDTTRCKKEFVCLSGAGDCLCEVQYSINNRSFFIKCEKKMLCNYKVSMGSYMLCGCPTRKEIYTRYQI